MALKDYPTIKAEFDKLSAEKAEIEAKIAPLREQYNAIQSQMDTLRDQQRVIGAQINGIEKPRMIEINQQLSAMARATGGRALSDA